MQMTLSRSQLTLDSAGFVTADGRPLNLPPKERAVLALLLARQPHVVSKSEFAAAAWGRQRLPVSPRADRRDPLAAALGAEKRAGPPTVTSRPPVNRRPLKAGHGAAGQLETL